MMLLKARESRVGVHAMGAHDAYGRRVLDRAARGAWDCHSPARLVRFKAGGWADLDGTIGDDIIVEVEGRNPKQIRGAVVDLVFHPRPKKLLVVLPANLPNPQLTA